MKLCLAFLFVTMFATLAAQVEYRDYQWFKIGKRMHRLYEECKRRNSQKADEGSNSSTDELARDETEFSSDSSESSGDGEDLGSQAKPYDLGGFICGTDKDLSFNRSNFRETIIFVQKKRIFGERLFLRGGKLHMIGCNTDDAQSDPCAIKIEHKSLGPNFPSSERDSFVIGDEYLSWGGHEPNQTEAAGGTYLQWTTNDPMDEHYVAANKFGPDYYMARFTMDCSTTKDGYFDVLVFDRDGPETYVEIGICVDPPYRTKRLAHVARCGHVNVFYHNRFRCMNYPLN